jgi:hypothetical protein
VPRGSGGFLIPLREIKAGVGDTGSGRIGSGPVTERAKLWSYRVMAS